jgi:TatD DNase family protein
VVVHLRDAFEHWDRVMERHGPPKSGGIMHCFSGDGAFALRCAEWGLHVSFAGNVTYPKAGNLREAAAAVPDDRLLLETDSPYLAPQPVRGRRCEPAHIAHTAACVASVRGVDPDTLARQTTANARRLFRLDGD